MVTAASTGAIYPDLADKIVLVTGGGSGIGEAIVRRFAAQRAKTAFIDIRAAEAGALAGGLAEQGPRVHFEPADLTDIAVLRAADRTDPRRVQWHPDPRQQRRPRSAPPDPGSHARALGRAHRRQSEASVLC